MQPEESVLEASKGVSIWHRIQVTVGLNPLVRTPVFVVFIAALVIRLNCYTGLIASDDLGYSAYAQQIAHGVYHLEPHHFAIRYGILLPLAAMYDLCGVHEWTTVALPLFASSLAAALLSLLTARLFGVAAGWIAGALLATFPVDVQYASILVPESILQAILLAGVLTFLKADKNNSALFSTFSGLLFGIAYITKESGIFVAAAFMGFALLQRRWRLVVWLTSGIAIILGAELAWYWLASGDPLFRYHAMTVHNSTPMAIGANQLLSWRLWKAYPRMMLIPNLDFGLHSVFVLGLSATALPRVRSSRTMLFLLLWATIPFLYLNFGTSSFSHFWALPAAPRYIILSYAPLFVLAAAILAGWSCAGSIHKALVGLAVGVICLVGIFCAAKLAGAGYYTDHVHRLKGIVAVARHDKFQMCGFKGPDEWRWRQILQIIAPDRVGCSSAAVTLVPDSYGLPIMYTQGQSALPSTDRIGVAH